MAKRTKKSSGPKFDHPPPSPEIDRDSPVSLQGLQFEQALKALLASRPVKES